MDPVQSALKCLSDYYAGDEFKAMARQAEEQQMRNAAATGGLRGGGNQAAMASISPMLGQQHLQGLQNQYTGLANMAAMGSNAASQGAQGAHATSVIINQQLQQQIGQAHAQAGFTKAGVWSNIWGGLAGGKRWRKHHQHGKGLLIWVNFKLFSRFGNSKHWYQIQCKALVQNARLTQGLMQ